ncbi:MAG: NB-ARC domain-containing protein [bacterium]|nr:NB-ARC domain-containing protein [bacterium]
MAIRRIFLSYSRDDDEPFVRRLFDDLTDAGFDVWFDRESIESRALSFYQEIQDAISRCDRLLLVLGPNAVKSDYVNQEWRFALETGTCVNPILRAGRPDSNDDAYVLVPEELFFLHVEDFRSDADYAVALRSLTRQLSEPLPDIGKLVAVPTLPGTVVRNRERLTELRDHLLLAVRTPTVESGEEMRISIHGMGGIGKSVLANSLARDHEVRLAFPDGVYWIPVGRSPRLLDLQRQLIVALGDDTAVDDIPSALQRLRELISDRRLLLILDDVWERAHAEAFDIVAPRSRLLLTTRDAGFSAAFAGKSYAVQSPSQEEAVSILARSSEQSAGQLPEAARDVAEACGRLPLALSLCGGMARKGAPWDRILRLLRDARLELVRDRHRVQASHQNLWNVIEVSVRELEADEQDRLAELATFLGNQGTPEAAVATLWSHSGELDELSTGDLLDELRDRSLVRLDLPVSVEDERLGRVVFVHDLVFNFSSRKLTDRLGEHRSPDDSLLEAYRSNCPNGWSSGPNDGYYFENLPRHLHLSGRGEELGDVLLDMDFVEAKLSATGVWPLTQDYDLALGGSEGERGRELRVLQRVLEFSSQALTEDPAFLRGQIIGRALRMESPVHSRLIERTTAMRGAPWLRPVLPALHSPEDGARRVFSGHSGDVRCVAMNRDATRFVSGGGRLGDGWIWQWDLDSGLGEPVCRQFGGVRSIALTPDGSTAMWTSGQSEDLAIIVWNLDAKSLVRRMIGHEKGIEALVVSPDAERVASGSWDETIRIWDLRSGELIATLSAHGGPVTSLSMSADGRWLASGSHDKTVKIWSMDTLSVVASIGQESRASSVQISPAGDKILVGGANGTIRVSRIETGEICDELMGHTREVTSIAVDASGRLAVSGSRDETIRVWDLDQGATTHTIREGYGVNAIALDPNGQFVLSASQSRVIRMWDLPDDSRGRTDVGVGDSRVGCVAVTRDGSTVLSGSDDGRVTIVHTNDGSRRRQLDAHSHGVGSVAATLDGRRVLSGASKRSVHARIVEKHETDPVRIWDLESGELLSEVPLARVDFGVEAILPTADGRRAVVQTSGGRLILLDLEPGTIRSQTEMFSSGMMCVAASDDGNVAVAGYGHGSLKVFDLNQGAEIWSGFAHEYGVRAVAISSDGCRAVSAGGDDTILVWNLHRDAPYAFAERAATLTGHTDTIWSLEMIDEDRRALSSSTDGTLRIWDLDRYEQDAILEGSRSWSSGWPMHCVAPEVRAAASFGDRTIHLWDLERAAHVAAFRTDTDIGSIEIDANGRTIVAAGRDGTLIVLAVEDA